MPFSLAKSRSLQFMELDLFGNVLRLSGIEHLSIEDGLEDGGYDKMDFMISCPKLIFFKYDAPAPRSYILDSASSMEIVHLYPWNRHQDEPALKEHVSYFIGLLKVVPNVVVLKLGIDIVTGFCESFDELSRTRCTFHGLKALNLWVTLSDDKMKFLVFVLEHSPKLEALTLYFDSADMYEQAENVKFPDLSKISCVLFS